MEPGHWPRRSRLQEPAECMRGIGLLVIFLIALEPSCGTCVLCHMYAMRTGDDMNRACSQVSYLSTMIMAG